MKIRLKYSKTAEGRFLSHLDLLRTVQRVIRRAGLPLAYSEGFNPHPKISYGSALAVGVTSDGEYLDFELREELPLLDIVKKLGQVMPPAIKVLEAKEIGDKKESLMAIINLARYEVEVAFSEQLSQEKAQNMLNALLSKDQLLVKREGKKGIRSLDIRPGIFDLSAQEKENNLLIIMSLQTGSNGNVRPEEVVDALRAEILEPLGIEVRGNLRIHRQGLFIKNGNTIRTPLDF